MKKSILFYINTLYGGGAERVLANLANQFSKHGNDVVVVTSFACKEDYQLENTVKRINLENSNCKRNVLVSNICRVSWLKAVIREIKPDIVISFMAEANFRAIIAADALKVPKIVSVRSDPNIEYSSRVYKVLKKILFLSADGIVFQTEDAQKCFPQKIQEKSTIILNQVAEAFFDRVKKTGEYYVATGRLSSAKNYHMMISAFAKFTDKFPDEKLFIFGDGDEKERLKQMIAGLGKENSIFLKGKTSDVSEVLSKSKGFLLSSDYEGMPNSLLEAMAMGIPCVVTDCPCGGPRALIMNHRDGILVPVGDKVAFYRELCYLRENPDKAEYYAQNARKQAERFKPETIFEQWNLYVDSVVSGKRTRTGEKQ